jgi:methylglyoxal/glyoxal reductase
MIENSIKLYNGVEIPRILMGTSLCDYKGKRKQLEKQLSSSIKHAVTNGILGFDSARDYKNENIIGNVLRKIVKENGVKREDIFIATKIGNSQQQLSNISEQINISLKSLKTDYIDLWMLHWPYPNLYIDNWKKMEDVYLSGKVKAIGICNCRERHLNALFNAGISIKPMVAQFEYHPFRTVPSLVKMCKEHNIQIEAYSALCHMLPFVRENKTLELLAIKFNKSIAQIIMRWHIQQGVIPIFGSLNLNRIKSNIDVFDFVLGEEDMESIFALNTNYKFHPESLNCPGF